MELNRFSVWDVPTESFRGGFSSTSFEEWIIDRYQVTTHKDSQITNDPNDYCREIDNPRYIVDLIKRVVTVSVETMKIVAQLPVLDVAA